MLLDRGYKDVIVLRIYGYGVDTEKKLEVPGGVNLYHVAPRRDLGGLLELSLIHIFMQEADEHIIINVLRTQQFVGRFYRAPLE